MKMRISKNWGIKFESYSYTLYERVKYGDKYEWKQAGFYVTLADALEGYLQRGIKEGNINNIKEIKEEIYAALDNVDKLCEKLRAEKVIKK